MHLPLLTTRLRSPNDDYDEEKYRLIHESLQDLHDVALMLGDSPLAESLRRLREWVQGKCQSKKPKPR
jgi:hypothetical protein